ncbi:MAG TPA: amino acid adenylation, partial [Tistrella mobilis]|nr:amino acid adenylation [Tistrella mobilis]
LPLYHDMGLVGNLLQPLWLGIPSVLMAPAAFLQKPMRWLRAISDWKATTAGSPDFGYDLCVRRFRPDLCEGLDLSSWSVAYNGAEPVRAETLERFAATFAPYGFRADAFYPCYGMAETTLMISGGSQGIAPPVIDVDGSALDLGRVVPPVAGAITPPRRLVGCGR